jgi:hypothetical protein
VLEFGLELCLGEAGSDETVGVKQQIIGLGGNGILWYSSFGAVIKKDVNDYWL